MGALLPEVIYRVIAEVLGQLALVIIFVNIAIYSMKINSSLFFHEFKTRKSFYT